MTWDESDRLTWDEREVLEAMVDMPSPAQSPPGHVPADERLARRAGA